MRSFLYYLDGLDNGLWSYLAIPSMFLVGIYLTFKLSGIQLTSMPSLLASFPKLWRGEKNDKEKRGIHPFKVFFTSIGGCIGVANLVSICYSIKLGGPGAVFWMWVTAFLGMAIKYSEVYLGVKYREKNPSGSYDGGPMFYLQKVYKGYLPYIVAFLLCIYGVEVYIFNVVVDSLTMEGRVNKYVVLVIFLLFVLYAGYGGMERVSNITSLIIPFFLVVFVSMSMYVLYQNKHALWPTIKLIFSSAFQGHAVLGGFAGSTMIQAMAEGAKRGCYTGDIGVGYAAVVHAESSTKDPAAQARLAIFGIFLDTFVICTLTTLIVLVTGVWNQGVSSSVMTQLALGRYFPYMNIFMPVFIFMLGYSTIIAFFACGLKAADFCAPRYGKKLYFLYATLSFVVFSFMDAESVITIMSICGALLLCCNVLGIIKLRDKIKR